MSVEFSNTYQEILFDNLISIIKQNFIFQTQLKIAEESGKVTAEIQTKYNELLQAHEILKDLKMKVDNNASAHEDKSRLQGALNDAMKQNTGLEKELKEIKSEMILFKMKFEVYKAKSIFYENIFNTVKNTIDNFNFDISGKLSIIRCDVSNNIFK